MYVSCKLCEKEFNDLVEGTRLSSYAVGNLLFCSANCCKTYPNAAANRQIISSIV